MDKDVDILITENKIKYLNEEIDRLDSKYYMGDNKFFPSYLIGYSACLAVAPPILLKLNYGVNPFTYSYNNINVNLIITLLAGSIVIPLGVMETIKEYKEYKLIKDTNRGVVSEGKYLLKTLKEEKKHLEELKNGSTNIVNNTSIEEAIYNLKNNCEKEFEKGYIKKRR